MEDDDILNVKPLDDDVPKPRHQPPPPPVRSSAPPAMPPPAVPPPVTNGAVHPTSPPPAPPVRSDTMPTSPSPTSPPVTKARPLSEAQRRPSMFDSSDEDDDDAPAAAASAAPTPRAAAPQQRRSAPAPMDVSKHDELLCEGFLTKVKGNALKNRSRFFRLTVKKLSYYEENAGLLISSIEKDSITKVEDCAGNRFKLHLKGEIGRNKGKTELVLEAPNLKVKKKWLGILNSTAARLPSGEELIVEGLLTKVQPLCTTNMTRWWQITNKRIMYYKEEAGDLYGAVTLDHVEFIASTEDKREFKISCNVPLTRTGFYDAVCRAPSQACRDKWVALMQRVIPQQKMSAVLQMCCFMET